MGHISSYFSRPRFVAYHPMTPRYSLSAARLYVPSSRSPRARVAARILIEEIALRTAVQLEVVERPDSLSLPWMILSEADLSRDQPQMGDRPLPEGFSLRVTHGSPEASVQLVAADDRGLLFGVGHLLRKLTLKRGTVEAPGDLAIHTSPRCSLRGHQLGYRPKTNSYDGWSLEQWERYIRDLAVFGANAIELIPPRSDDEPDSPHFRLPPLRMMQGMSRIADEYGLDVWIWFPAMDENYEDADVVRASVEEWGEIFEALPRVDAVFVPGGDPGHTAPRTMMKLLEVQTANLHRFHPGAGMWVSPQGFDRRWMDEFLQQVGLKPEWLTGVVYGPQTRMGLREFRQGLPDELPIRLYPDITHTVRCQYPVEDWDLAFDLCEGREPINPRPAAMARIFQETYQDSIGFITYSEGCNDDVNKAVWSALGWAPECSIQEILEDYSRYFIGPDFASTFSRGLLALEQNWAGPALQNDSIDVTLLQFQEMERTASPHVKQNWRFQQALYRAFYDAYIRVRLLSESAAEHSAADCLRAAPRVGSLTAMQNAATALMPAAAAVDLRARVFELAEALFQSISMQLSVDRYAAISVGRGANLDTIDEPLNDRLWLLDQFTRIRAVEDESSRQEEISRLVNWRNPGPGGFYDQPGNPLLRPHLVLPSGSSCDSQFRDRPLIGFSGETEDRRSSMRHAEALYDGVLQMRYSGLDPDVRYCIKIVYGSERLRAPIKLDASGFSIHPFAPKPCNFEPVTHLIPPAAIENGELLLTWTTEPGHGGNGRGLQLAEIWLMQEQFVRTGAVPVQGKAHQGE